MSREQDIARLPDSATCYVPGFGEATLGEIRRARERRPDAMEATLLMWEDIATRNLLRKPGQNPVPIADIVTHHANGAHRSA